MSKRGTSNSDSRGSSYDRKIRKIWVLKTFGDGETADCSFGCGTRVNYDTITIDRYPLAGMDGGRYVRGNIRPSCAPCNSSEGSLLMWSRKG